MVPKSQPSVFAPAPIASCTLLHIEATLSAGQLKSYWGRLLYLRGQLKSYWRYRTDAILMAQSYDVTLRCHSDGTELHCYPDGTELRCHPDGTELRCHSDNDCIHCLGLTFLKFYFYAIQIQR